MTIAADAGRFENAVARIDAAHAEDPSMEIIGGAARPGELVYAERMSGMLERFAPGASEALRLAVRCQHMRRWVIPRTSYPATSAGYKEWRARLLVFQADVASEILREAGYDDDTIRRVAQLVRKEGIKRDSETQLLEDVAALVFIEHHLADFARHHTEYDEAKLIDILGKTLRKMSSEGRRAARKLVKAPADVARLVEKAVSGEA